LRACLLIAQKDLTTEARTKVVFSSTVIFSLLVLIVFHFAFDLGRVDPRPVASGILWVAFIFSGTLGISRSFQYEKENGCLDALILSPVGPGAVFLGKLAGNLLFMLILEGFLILVFLVLFNVTVTGSLLLHGAVIFLATLGFVTVGTLLSAVSVNLRAREIMLPVLLFPVEIPVLMAAVKSSGLLMLGGPFEAIQSWLGILVAFDAIYLVSSVLVFEYVIQE
jgi:heme exporter protein B